MPIFNHKHKATWKIEVTERLRQQSKRLSPHLDTLQRIQMLWLLATLLVWYHISIHGDSDRGHRWGYIYNPLIIGLGVPNNKGFVERGWKKMGVSFLWHLLVISFQAMGHPTVISVLVDVHWCISVWLVLCLSALRPQWSDVVCGVPEKA